MDFEIILVYCPAMIVTIAINIIIIITTTITTSSPHMRATLAVTHTPPPSCSKLSTSGKLPSPNSTTSPIATCSLIGAPSEAAVIKPLTCLNTNLTLNDLVCALLQRTEAWKKGPRLQAAAEREEEELAEDAVQVTSMLMTGPWTRRD